MANKVKVVVVVHGSRRARWVAMQEEWFAGVRDAVRSHGATELEPELAFLEVTEPLFADVLERNAREGEPVLVFPFFLSRSGHVGDDIPELAEQVLEGRVPWRITQAEDWADVLARNAERRLAAAGAGTDDPVVVCGYGSSHHEGQWRDLVAGIQERSAVWRNAEPWQWAACGHFLEDAGEPFRRQVAALAAKGHRRVAVLPLFLAVASYQEELIPSVMREFPGVEFLYRPDAILPDTALEQWAGGLIAHAAGAFLEDIKGGSHLQSSLTEQP